MLYCFLSYSAEQLAHKRMAFFSYGSGLAATFFSARFIPGDKLNRLVESLSNLDERLKQRRQVPPAEFEVILTHKEKTHHLGINQLVILLPSFNRLLESIFEHFKNFVFQHPLSHPQLRTHWIKMYSIWPKSTLNTVGTTRCRRDRDNVTLDTFLHCLVD